MKVKTEYWMEKDSKEFKPGNHTQPNCQSPFHPSLRVALPNMCNHQITFFLERPQFLKFPKENLKPSHKHAEQTSSIKHVIIVAKCKINNFSPSGINTDRYLTNRMT